MLAIGQNHEHDRRVVLIVFETGDQFHPKKSNKKKQNKTKTKPPYLQIMKILIFWRQGCVFPET